MRKSLFFVFTVLFSLAFISCKDFWDSVTSATTTSTCILKENVESKTEYKSFSELSEPLILNVPVYDAGYNSVGSICVIWDCDKNEMYDWVYTEKTVNIWNYAACVIEPAPGKTMYLSGGGNYSNYVLMDPSQTSLKVYPKTKQGELSKYINVAPKKPRYLAPVTAAKTKEEELNFAAYFTAFDTADGSNKASVGFKQNNIQDGYIPDQNGNYVFVRSELDIPIPIPEDFSPENIVNKYYLCEYNPGTNSITQETELNIDSSCISPDNTDLMKVVYADGNCVLIFISFGVYNEATELIDMHRRLVVITDRTAGTVPASNVINLDSFCTENNITECDNAFKLGGNYYLVFEKFVDDPDIGLTYSNEFIKLDLSTVKVSDTGINIEVPNIPDLWVCGNRIYYVWSNNDYGVDFNYYDFSTQTKGECQTLDGNIFNQ